MEENNDHQPQQPQIPPLPPVPPAPQSPQLSPIVAESTRLLGAPGGPEIDNKNTILGDIDEVLGVRKPPSIEFIFVEPYPYIFRLKSEEHTFVYRASPHHHTTPFINTFNYNNIRNLK